MNSQNPQDKIQEMQLLEQTLQNIAFQKQAFQMELSETRSSIKEIENSDDDVFKVIGQLMIKSDKKKLKEELANREKLLDLRVKSLEKQEDPIEEKLEKLREELTGSIE